MHTKTLSALAEPNRVRVLELLREHPYSVSEIGEALHLRQPQASKHLQYLHAAGLVSVQPNGHKHMYSLEPEPLKELDEWLTTFKHHWEKRLSALDDYLEVMKEEKKYARTK